MISVRNNRLRLPDGRSFDCALGKGGLSNDKREGDGASPIGRFLIRPGYYRADRLDRPETRLSMSALSKEDGWSDDPRDPAYNTHVLKPWAYSHEDLWREDAVYDVIIPLGYNDDPPVPGLGSAIFMHVARDGYAPTEGCVALNLPDLLTVLKSLTEASEIVIEG